MHVKATLSSGRLEILKSHSTSRAEFDTKFSLLFPTFVWKHVSSKCSTTCEIKIQFLKRGILFAMCFTSSLYCRYKRYLKETTKSILEKLMVSYDRAGFNGKGCGENKLLNPCDPFLRQCFWQRKKTQWQNFFFAATPTGIQQPCSLARSSSNTVRTEIFLLLIFSLEPREEALQCKASLTKKWNLAAIVAKIPVVNCRQQNQLVLSNP